MTRDTFKAKGTPPPAAAEPKTLPVPTRVYLTDKAAVIVGYPQRGRDEDGPDDHNCDDMGCPTFGRHVLARVPFTDERAEQPAAAHEPSAAAAAIQFALTDPEGMTFLRLWNEGEFDTLRREWPDAPREVYDGADPLT